jgi:adenylate kinase
MPEIIILIGPQGAGKGTQAQLLAERLSLPIVATGDMLREIGRSDTSLGRQVKRIQEAGQLVPDDILAEVIKARTDQEDCNNGYLLDGFPRTMPQAEMLEEIARRQGHHIIAISIDVPRDLLFKRLTGRLNCRQGGHIYNIYSKPPKREGICDVDGSELYQRPDDTPEAIAKRLAEYDEKTMPILHYYAKTGRLTEVDGTVAPEEVFGEIVRIVAQAV